jgi:hypothetical protein
MIGMPNINQYFKVAMGYPIAKLQAIIRGQDHSIPAIAAMAAFEIKGPMEIAAKAQQALQKQSPISVRDKLAQEGEEKGGMLPDNAMMAMQQQQQGSLPENTGIGQLPAPNMQTMNAANGGIIAFDDGGEVPGYAGEDGSVVGQGFRKEPMFTAPKRSMSSMIKQKELESGAQGVQEEIVKLKEQLASLPPGPQRTFVEQRLQLLTGRAAASPTPEAPDMAPPLAQSEVDKLVQANKSMQNMPREVIPSVEPTQRRAPSAARATPATPQGADTEQQMADVMSRISGTQDAEIKSQYADLKKQQDAGIAALRREREVGRPTGKAFEGLETELKEEKDAVKGKEAKNLQMALINAGLAIAGGSSRYAMENIGKGALVGTKQYTDGLDKLEAAAKERRKMTAMIDEARRAEARGDFKEKNEFETKAFELDINFRKNSIDAIAKISGENKKVAADIFNNLETQRHADIRNRETNATTREVYKNRAGGGEYNVLADNARARYAEWVKSDAGKLALLKDPGLADRKYVEYLRDEYATKGLPLPSNLTGGATMPGGAGPKFLGFEKQ